MKLLSILAYSLSSHRSLIYSQIKYVYSEYPAQVNTFSFTINGIDCNSISSNNVVSLERSSFLKL